MMPTNRQNQIRKKRQAQPLEELKRKMLKSFGRYARFGQLRTKDAYSTPERDDYQWAQHRQTLIGRRDATNL